MVADQLGQHNLLHTGVDLMKLDFSKCLLDQNDKPFQVNGRDYTLLDACGSALLMQMPNEQMTGEEKHRRYLLWTKIKADGAVDITVDEAALLKLCVGAQATPLIVGQIWKTLDET